MVPTELFETDITGHIHRDIVGLFNLTATAVSALCPTSNAPLADDMIPLSLHASDNE